MTYQLLHPVMLIALAGLLLPLLIHIWNRQKGRIIPFGSIKWLEATQRKKLSSISFTQPFLFFLRSIMVGLCVLLLIEPVRVQMVELLPQKNQNWVLVTPDLLERDDWQAGFDTAQYRGCEWRALAGGFPELVNSPPPYSPSRGGENQSVDIWSLLADVQERADAPDSVFLFFTPKIQQFQSEPPTLSMHINWLEVPAKDDHYQLIRAWRPARKKLTFLYGKSNAEQTVFEQIVFDIKDSKNTQSISFKTYDLPDVIVDLNDNKAWFQQQKDSIFIEESIVLNVAVKADRKYKKDREYIRAALKAVSQYTGIELRWKKVEDKDVDAVFWLSEEVVPNEISASASRLFLFEENRVYGDNILDRDLVSGREVFVFNQRLSTAKSTTQLPTQLLMTILTPDDFEQQLARFDQRKIEANQYAVKQIKPTDSYQDREKETIIEEKRVAGFHHWFWVLLAIIFLLERWVQASVMRKNTIARSQDDYK